MTLSRQLKISDLQEYLHETLGVVPRVKPFTDTRGFPHFLRDAFELYELHLMNQAILLAVDKRSRPPAIASLRKQLAALQMRAQRPVAYVIPTLASYERKRLIEQKVPFIVPGNQLYLPSLGIDLREYFRQQAQTERTQLSPATQAILVAALLRRPWQANWKPTELATELGYTAMTLSRAIRELTAANLATLRQERRVRVLQSDSAPSKIWESAMPLLRSPVRRTAWALPGSGLRPSQLRQAGLSALAHYTMLAEPQWPVYAVTVPQWNAATRSGLRVLTEPESDACEWQVWNYSPQLLSGAATVDSLSLTLSLKGENDERVQQALDQLKEQFPW